MSEQVEVVEEKTVSHIVLPFQEGRGAKWIIEAISTIVEEADVKFTPQGMSLKALDPSRVAMIQVKIPAQDGYQCEKETILGVDFKTLSKFLKRVRKDESVKLVVKNGKVSVVIEGKVKRTFTINAYAVEEYQELPDVNVKYVAEAKVILAELASIIRDLDTMRHSTVLITISPEGVSLKSGDELSTAEISMKDAVVEVKTEETVSVAFSLEHLSGIIKKLDKLAEIITIRLAPQKPLELECETIAGKIKYWLAPSATE